MIKEGLQENQLSEKNQRAGTEVEKYRVVIKIINAYLFFQRREKKLMLKQSQSQVGIWIPTNTKTTSFVNILHQNQLTPISTCSLKQLVWDKCTELHTTAHRQMEQVAAQSHVESVIYFKYNFLFCVNKKPRNIRSVAAFSHNGSETKPVGTNLRIESTLLSSLIFPRSSALQRISLFDPDDVQFVTRYNLCPIQFVPDTVCVRYNLCPIQIVPIQIVPIQFVPIQFVHEP